MIELDRTKRTSENVPIVYDGPFLPAVRCWQVRPPEDALIVTVKTTFAIGADGELTPIAEQEPPIGDVYERDDPAASVRYASDFAIYKPRADVMLVGHAYASSPRATASTVKFSFGRAISQTLAVFGDRTWVDGKPSEPRPLTRVPLTFERAFGGPGHDDNPVGMGLVDGIAVTRLPNVERPDRLIRAKGDRPIPACFGPIAPTWKARASRLGTYDAVWRRDAWPYFPKDFDFGHFNAAHASQQIPYPRGDEAFELAGVHPELPVIRGKLPGLVPAAFAQFGRERDNAFRPLELDLDTVWFDADALRVLLVWRGRLDVSSKRAPEVVSLFVMANAVGQELTPAAAQARYFELTGAGAPKTLVDPAPAQPQSSADKDVPPPPAPTLTRAAVESLVASGAALSGLALAGSDLSGLDLSGRALAGAILQRARLDDAQLPGADLRGAVLAGASLARANLRGADLRGANLADATLRDADLTGAALDDASLASIDASGAIFTRATLHRANLADARLVSANFDEAVAEAADLSGAVVVDASFKRAKLDDAQLYGAAAEGAAFDDASLVRFRADDANLERASFVRANGKESTFQRSKLVEANFTASDFTEAVFNEANLERANFAQVTARRARFRYARCVAVRAARADLMEANFEAADLSRADLTGANLYAVETLDAVLTGARLDGAIVAGSKLADPNGPRSRG